MSKNLTITISGAPAAGKTTLASELAALLSDLGFRVTVEDFDLQNGNARSGELHQQALDAMVADGREIVVRTVQTARGGKREDDGKSRA